MKKLENTEIDDAVVSSYFEGKVIDKLKTEMGHLLFKCIDVNEIKVIDGVKTIITGHPSGNYVIPKRRLEIYKDAEANVKYGKRYVFKLQEESRSKKLMVSQVFEVA